MWQLNSQTRRKLNDTIPRDGDGDIEVDGSPRRGGQDGKGNI